MGVPEPRPEPPPLPERIAPVTPLRQEVPLPPLPPAPAAGSPAFATLGARNPGRRGGRVFGHALIAWIIALVAVLGAGVGFSLRQGVANDLRDTRAALSATQANLRHTQGTLATTRRHVADLEARNRTLTDSNATLGDKVDACQLAYRIDYLVSMNRMKPTSTNYENWMNAVNRCYGKTPTWMR